MATMYELHFRDPLPQPPISSLAPAAMPPCPLQTFTLKRIVQAVDLPSRLQDRECLPPEELKLALAARVAAHGHRRRHATTAPAQMGAGAGALGGSGFRPRYPVERLFPGAYFLDRVGEDETREYARRPVGSERVKGGPLAPPTAVGVGAGGPGEGEEEAATTDESESGPGEEVSSTTSYTVHKALGVAATGPESKRSGQQSPGAALGAASGLEPLVEVGVGPAGEVEEEGTGAGARGIPRVVVTGVACGLPGQERVFEVDNLSRLLGGQNCIQPLCEPTVKALVEKNVVQQMKRVAKGVPPVRIPITEADQTIKLAAKLGSIDMVDYGVTASIAATMDKAVKVAVVAGLEALRDAGIVTGEGEGGWLLPGHMRDTTGVMYASSYPALDAAIGEVMRFLRSRCITRAKKSQLVEALRERLRSASPTGQVSEEDEEALLGLQKALVTGSTMDLSSLAGYSADPSGDGGSGEEEEPNIYEFDRKFLFRVLVLGNAQLAQMVGARGPNMQTNAACAGSTLAVAMAQ
ncbi:unnamed protein product, partial [Discosporangium mesarthrocarpum]